RNATSRNKAADETPTREAIRAHQLERVSSDSMDSVRGQASRSQPDVSPRKRLDARLSLGRAGAGFGCIVNRDRRQNLRGNSLNTSGDGEVTGAIEQVGEGPDVTLCPSIQFFGLIDQHARTTIEQ